MKQEVSEEDILLIINHGVEENDYSFYYFYNSMKWPISYHYIQYKKWIFWYSVETMIPYEDKPWLP